MARFSAFFNAPLSVWAAPGAESGTVPPPALSPEVRNFYETYLHRAPDAQGAVEYQGQLDRGVSPSIIEAQILGSPEAVQALSPDEMANQTTSFRAIYGLSPTEVQTLSPLASDFAKAVGRPVDTPTLKYWDQEIDAGTSMAALEAQVLTAPETQANQAPGLPVSAWGNHAGVPSCAHGCSSTSRRRRFLRRRHFDRRLR